MGTTYSIKLVNSGNDIPPDSLKFGIDSILTSIDNEMSTWNPNSEISKFNRFSSMDPFPISVSFANVVQSALDVSKKTDGYFDITVFDIMQNWGFGPNPKSGFPDLSTISEILKYSGYHQIELIDQTIIKKHPQVKLDLNAIAKGHGVDEVFLYLKSKGFMDIFVEIGGEVRCVGKNQNGNPWSIGIQNPPNGSFENEPIAGIVNLIDGAVATSGNYRNFIDLNGDTLGHTINPKTGFPIQTNVISVTVQANSCMIADAWATALMTLDYREGFSLVKNNPEIDVVWIIESEEGVRSVAKTKNASMENSIYSVKPS